MPVPSPANRALWELVQRRARQERPQVARAILQSFQRLRSQLSDAAIRDALASGNVEAIVQQAMSQAQMEAAFVPLRDQLRTTLGRSVAYQSRNLPPAPTPPGIPPIPGSTIATMFDQLNPRVVDAIKGLETTVVSSLQADAQATVRQVVQRGLEAGQGPKAFAKDLRSSIGLSPAQEKQVANFRAALKGEDGRSPFDYLKRDKQFDKTIEKALGKDGKGLTDQQIDMMVERYRARRIALNAETTARTASLEALKSGQRLSVQDAIDKGIYDPNTLMRQWIGVGDDRERPEHVAMNNTVVAWGEDYPNGDSYPGESSPWNCRCIERTFTRRDGK